MYNSTLFRLGLFGFLLLIFMVATSASADPGQSGRLLVRVDLSDQIMSVTTSTGSLPKWRISTARKPYRTPIGTFKPQRLERMWYSRKYDYAPMPHSIFFHGGYAIHGTTELKRLGTPASHGCIRLHPDHARTLFGLVKKYGRTNTVIRIDR